MDLKELITELGTVSTCFETHPISSRAKLNEILNKLVEATEPDTINGLHFMHPAMVTINSLQERVAALEAELGRSFVVERGPWEVSKDGRHICSDDFTHDVCLAISGDFGSDEQRKIYAEEIARRLNNSY